MFENIVNFFKKLKKNDKGIDSKSKETAKERLHLVLMQDRANVSADFMELMKETGRRDGFEIRSEEYFRNFLQAFHGNAKLCIAKLDGKVLSGALLVNYANVTSYVYGCSSNEYRKYMPNYLMQWTMIKYAIESGCHTYDFCGIPYWYDETHKNYGVYRFKQGFNGKVKTYAGEFDYVFRNGVNHIADLAMKLKKLV